MALKPMEPARLKIFKAEAARFRMVGQVKVLDIFQNNTRDFHEEGLFSTSIFGRVGSNDRLTRFGYIDLRVPILHPRIFSRLCSLKQLYKEIMSGKEYAVWDPKEKDFVKSDQMNGETGYYFFLKHFAEINFKRTSSNLRDGKIEVVRQNVDRALTEHILVIPAGYRDLEVDEHGGTDQHEINDFYRTLIKISNTLSTIHDLNSPVIDKARFSLQIAFNELHDYLISNSTKGKGSFFSSKFGRRKIRYGTRNVFAAASSSVRHLDDPTNFLPDHTQIGLFQAIKASEPLFIHHLKVGYLDEVFRGENSAWLIDPKTLNRVEVHLKPRTVDRWTNAAGLTKIINTFQNISIRNEYIMVDGHYLGLIYKRDGKFKLLHSLDDIPADRMDDKDYVYPITYGELFFALCNRYIGECPADITRYPIAGADSIYPSYNYLMSTANALRMVELDEEWNETIHVTSQFPNTDVNIWFDTLGPHSTRITGMGGDYDGDTGNDNVNMSEEAKEDTKKYLNSLTAHIDVDGRMIASPLVDPIKRIIYNMTGE